MEGGKADVLEVARPLEEEEEEEEEEERGRPVKRSIVGWGEVFLAEPEEEPVPSAMRSELLLLVEEGVGLVAWEEDLATWEEGLEGWEEGLGGWGEGERPALAGRGTAIT